MKSIFRLLLLLPLCVNAQAPHETIVQVEPKNVTLYLSGAQIEAKGSLKYEQGVQTLLINKLPASIDPGSIEFRSEMPLIVLGVDYQVNYLEAQQTPEFKKYQDSLEYYKRQSAVYGAQILGFNEELAMLQANRRIAGENTAVSVAELQKMAEFVRARTTEATNRKNDTEEKQRQVQDRIRKIEQQLAQLRANVSRPTGQITVEFQANASGTGNFEVSYYTSNCGWQPVYDFRVKEVGSPATLVAKAAVYQQTGQDWKNVNLSLSTGNPSLGNTMPYLNPWYINLVDPLLIQARGARVASAPLAKTREADMPAATAEIQTLANFSAVEPSAVNARFKINIPVSIGGAEKQRQVEIQQYQLNAGYSYFTAPKLENDAFLVCTVKDWTQTELLAGEASIYFGNNYIGKSWFDPVNTTDSIQIGLGRDNQVRVERKLLKDLTEKSGLSGNTRKITRSYEITIRNSRTTAIELRAEDQIPVSQNSELSVELNESTNAVYDKDSGKLSWILNLKPGETRKLVFSYSVKFPKKMNITGF